MIESSPEKKPDIVRKIQREFGIIIILEGNTDHGSEVYKNTLDNLYRALKDLKKHDAGRGNEFIRRTSIYVTDADAEKATPEGKSGFSVNWNDAKATMIRKIQRTRQRRGKIYEEDRETLPLDE